MSLKKKPLKKLLLIIAIFMGVSCNNQDNSKQTIIESDLTTTFVKEKYTNINLAYELKENIEVRKFQFLNLDQNINFITFLESELSYLEIEKKVYYNIDYNFAVNSNIEESIQLFEDKLSGDIIFLFNSFTEEFPSFHVFELLSSGTLEDNGKYTLSWDDFKQLEIKNVDEIVYSVTKDDYNINIKATTKSGNSSILNSKDTFQPIEYGENKIQFHEILNNLENSHKSTIETLPAAILFDSQIEQ